MPRKKQIKLDELNTLRNVFLDTNSNIESGLVSYLGNENCSVLEVGCGHGNYTVSLANNFPYKNFIGIDVKGARIWKGAKDASALNLKNIAFIVCGAHRLSDIFPSYKMEEIWITFPEPHIQRRKENRRLTSPYFLEIYKRILKPGGLVHLKTDNTFLFDYTLNILNSNKLPIHCCTNNLHSSQISGPAVEIITTFEKHYIKEGRKIKYVTFGIDCT